MSRSAIAQLWELQQLDTESERTQREIETLRRHLAADATQAARAALDEGTRQANARAQAVREAEATLQETQTRLRRQEQRLYGGGAGSRELEPLQQEIAHLQATRTAQEETLLEAMLANEEAQARLATLRSALEEAQRAQGAERTLQTEQLEQMEARVRELRARRNQAAGAVAAETLARYEAIRKARGGRAVAEVRQGICEACRVAITSTTLHRARAGTELVTCGNCGRILYVA
jgi:predicted  nucleic acid-binding Zn-ribbon protein